MNLDPLDVLRSASIGMMDGSMLGPREGYEQASSIVIGLAFSIVADQLENGAANLVEENSAMREIFNEALGISEVGSASLRTRMEIAATETDDSLRLSVLRETNDALRDLLGELLASIEDGATGATAGLEDHLWDELSRSTQRRAVAIAPF